MSKAFSKQDVVQAAIEGIESAFDRYLGLTGEDWLDWAPESFVVCSIADTLYVSMQEKGWITLECSVSDFLAGANQAWRAPGRPREALRSGGRFDIALYFKDGTPRAPIEVKHPVYFTTTLGSDAERLCSALGKDGVQFGMLAFYTSCDEPERKDRTLKDRLVRRGGEIRKYLAKIAEKNGCTVKLHGGTVHVRDYDEKKNTKKAAWQACCATFEREA